MERVHDCDVTLSSEGDSNGSQSLTKFFEDVAAYEEEIEGMLGKKGMMKESRNENNKFSTFKTTYMQNIPKLPSMLNKYFNSTRAIKVLERNDIEEDITENLETAFGKEIHKRMHTGEKTFVCLPCGKSYRQSHHLVRHNGTLLEKQKT